MEFDNAIYLPLAGNFNWFESEDSFNALDRHLKTVVAIFDVVVFENGRLHLSAGEDGQGMCHSFPGDSFPDDRLDIKPYQLGSVFGVDVNGVQLFQSKAAYSVDADYFPFLTRAGIADSDFIKWSNHSLNQEFGTWADKVGVELSNAITGDLRPFEMYFYREVAKRYPRDACLAFGLGMPVCLDRTTSHIATSVAQREDFKLDLAGIAYAQRSIPMLNVPDFGDWSWDEIITFRESASGIDFRAMLKHVAAVVQERTLSGSSESELQRVSDIALGQVLANEVAKRRCTGFSFGLSTLLNIIPYGGLAGVAKDAMSLIKDRRSWISVLSRKAI